MLAWHHQTPGRSTAVNPVTPAVDCMARRPASGYYSHSGGALDRDESAVNRLAVPARALGIIPWARSSERTAPSTLSMFASISTCSAPIGAFKEIPSDVGNGRALDARR
jgi:hypothetical protein